MIVSGTTAVQDIAAVIRQYVSADKKVIYMVPGGSAASVALEALDHIPVQLQPNITVTLTDERCGPIGHSNSNWNAVEQYLEGKQFGRLPILSNTTAIESAQQWSSGIAELMSNNAVVVAVLGIGEDAHTAGIKPNMTLGEVYAAVGVHYQAEDYERISIAPEFFSKIDNAFVYAKGSSKKAVIYELDHNTITNNAPATLVKRAKSLVIYYTN